jgi:hypothetical protein
VTAAGEVEVELGVDEFWVLGTPCVQETNIPDSRNREEKKNLRRSIAKKFHLTN